MSIYLSTYSDIISVGYEIVKLQNLWGRRYENIVHLSSLSENRQIYKILKSFCEKILVNIVFVFI